MDGVFERIYTTIISNIQKYLGKGSRSITDSVIDHATNISKYKPLAGSSYTKLQNEFYHPRKGLIHIQNINDNEWLARYLHPTHHNPRIIRKVDKLFGDKLGFKDITFPVKVRDIHKTEKKNSIVFLVMEIRNIQSMCQKIVAKISGAM